MTCGGLTLSYKKKWHIYCGGGKRYKHSDSCERIIRQSKHLQTFKKSILLQNGHWWYRENPHVVYPSPSTILRHYPRRYSELHDTPIQRCWCRTPSRDYRAGGLCTCYIPLWRIPDGSWARDSAADTSHSLSLLSLSRSSPCWPSVSSATPYSSWPRSSTLQSLLDTLRLLACWDTTSTPWARGTLFGTCWFIFTQSTGTQTAHTSSADLCSFWVPLLLFSCE